MGAAIQQRVNRAITDRLRSDTLASPAVSGDSLQELLQLAGADLSNGIPLYWDMAPSSAARPYIVYGPQQRESQAITTLCGEAVADEVLYEIRFSTGGIDPSGSSIDIVDRIGALLDRYRVVVRGVTVELYRVGDFCYPDWTATERGATVSGIVYRCRVHL